MKRLSVLFTVFLTACLPMRVETPPRPAGPCDTQPPTAAEAAAWQNATSRKTRNAYRDFLMSYPRSCYAALATERMRAAPRPAPVTVRRVAPPAPAPTTVRRAAAPEPEPAPSAY